jgi:hypothetical protein
VDGGDEHAVLLPASAAIVADSFARLRLEKPLPVQPVSDRFDQASPTVAPSHRATPLRNNVKPVSWRFQKRRKLLPGVTLNLGKRGAGVSAGPRGAKVSVGRRGLGVTLSLLGTGLAYVWRRRR